MDLEQRQQRERLKKEGNKKVTHTDTPTQA